MLKTITLFIAFAICMAFNADAQNKTLAKANKLYKEKDYQAAIPLFVEGLAMDDSFVAKSKLATAYQRTNQLVLAEKVYSGLVYDDKAKISLFKAYGETLMGNGKYAAAKFWFEEYLKKKPDDTSVKRNLESCNKVFNIKPRFYDVVVEDFPFNSEFDDNGAVLTNGNLYFSSDRPTGLKLLKQKVSDDGREFINIYTSSNENGQWGEPSALPNKVNVLNKNVGPITFSADGTFAIFSKNIDEPNKRDQFPLHLFSVNWDGSKWKDIKPLPFCRPSSNYMHPSMSPDGTKLFFISEKAGGEGSTDIYMSEKIADNWSSPVNLGPGINTSESEAFPFAAANGNLYFSSKGYLGFGGYDIYESTPNGNGGWNKPLNLGFPMNSSSDDLSFYINESEEQGIFSSSRNRKGDDVFVFSIGKEIPKQVEEEIAFVPEEKTPETIDEEMVEEMVEQPVVEKEPVVEIEEVVETIVEEQPKPEVPEVLEMVEEKVEAVEIAEVPVPKKKEMNTINRKSDEAIKKEMKSDTIFTGRAQDLEVEKVAVVKVDQPEQSKVAKESVKEVTKEVVMESADEDGFELDETVEVPSDLVDVNTSGGMVKSVETKMEEMVIAEKAPQVKTSTPEAKMEEISIPETEVDGVEEVAAQIKEPKSDKKKKKKEKKSKDKVEEIAEVKIEDPVVETTIVEQQEARMAEEQSPTPSASLATASSAATEIVQAISAGNKTEAIKIGDLKYAFNATEITDNLGASLDEIARVLQENASINIKLIGHTASIGSDEKNLRLSSARAAAAVDYLVQKGIDPQRLSYEGRGEAELVNDCNDGVLCGRSQHQENERIEIEIL